MGKWMLNILKFKQCPPILIPLYFILEVVSFPFKIIKPIFMWLIGRWECYKCDREYGVKDKKILTQIGYDLYGYRCEACDIAMRLEK